MAVVMRRATVSLGNLVSRPLLPVNQVTRFQFAGIISKVLRDKDYEKPYPFPYKTRNYNLLDSIFDKTTWRFDENSKIIVVDGPPTSGKAKCAKELADALDMHYIPHSHLDQWYINPYGYDMRQLNDKLPAFFKSFDIHEFVANPNDPRSATLQRTIFKIRLVNYMDALTHVLSTGQGVVMNRSIYSDFVFLETFVKFGILSAEFKKYYYIMKQAIIPDLMRPHLVIYLDTPVNVILERIKKRNRPEEINSPIFKPDLLAYMENVYKHQFLKTIGKHAELLIYDTSEELEPELIVEDIERVKVDIEDYWLHDTKMKDWRLVDEGAWNSKRICLTTYRWETEMWVDIIPYFDCPEILANGEDSLEFRSVWYSAPGMKYIKGYNKDMGDANISLKVFEEK